MDAKSKKRRLPAQVSHSHHTQIPEIPYTSLSAKTQIRVDIFVVSRVVDLHRKRQSLRYTLIESLDFTVILIPRLGEGGEFTPSETQAPGTKTLQTPIYRRKSPPP